MSELNQLNDRLRTLRLERNFTQQELGDLLGITAQAVSKWETGIATPDITLLPKIAGLFNIHLSEFFRLLKREMNGNGLHLFDKSNLKYYT